MKMADWRTGGEKSGLEIKGNKHNKDVRNNYENVCSGHRRACGMGSTVDLGQSLR